jgi:uncharacterized protein (TIGR02145 family)
VDENHLPDASDMPVGTMPYWNGDEWILVLSGCIDPTAFNYDAEAVVSTATCLYGPAQCQGQSSITYDGHSYALVGIGTQCWFKENLRSDNYRNGDAIPGNLTDAQWSNTTGGAQAVYNNEAANLSTYGRLYNWYAVSDGRGLCPAGFHVPSDEEWMNLEIFLGMPISQTFLWGNDRGSNQGTQLKSSPSDLPNWSGTNSSGFSGLPGGNRSFNSLFSFLGSYGYWWSETSTGIEGVDRYLYHSDTVGRMDRDFRNGLSVRCLKD